MRTTLAALWAYGAAKAQGWTVENIVLEIPRFKQVREAPGILTLELTKTILGGAWEHAPELVPLLAIQAFAGLRRSEALALDWDEINFEKKDIYVSGAKSKTASWRIAPMPENLIAWLTGDRQQTGPIVPWHDLKGGKAAVRHTATIEGHRRRELMAKIGMKSLPKNGLRHTAATYRLAALGDSARVATELGHSQKILLAHYRVPARREDAEKYFAIVPPKTNTTSGDRLGRRSS
jgi:integrase